MIYAAYVFSAFFLFSFFWVASRFIGDGARARLFFLMGVFGCVTFFLSIGSVLLNSPPREHSDAIDVAVVAFFYTVFVFLYIFRRRRLKRRESE